MSEISGAPLSGTGSHEPSPNGLGPPGFDPSRMTKDQKSFLLYAETCCVDHGGLLVGERMNADDHEAAALFCERGLMFFGRIPGNLLKGGFAQATHYCELTLSGWELAWQLRRLRADRRDPYASEVWSHPVTLERLTRDTDGSRHGGDACGSVRSTTAGAEGIAQDDAA